MWTKNSNLFSMTSIGHGSKFWLSLMLFFFCISSHADTYGDFSYSVSGTNLTITGYTGTNKNITIPSSIPGLGMVTTIGNSAFAYNTNLTSVIIPDSVFTIEDYAFIRSSITNITIGNSVTSMGVGIFESCIGLTSITIPDSVSSLGNSMFYGCTSLTNMIIGNSVTIIGNYVFNNCISLTSITIPSSVTKIGVYVFRSCTSLTNITVDAKNTVYTSLNGVLFNKNKTLLILYPCRIIGSYSIPNSVTNIGDSAFSNSTNLISISIPNSVINIESSAFNNCINLPSITIPDSVTFIGYNAFYNCNNLTNVIFGNNVTNIQSSSFKNCTKLISITIPNSVVFIGSYVFYNCSQLVSAYFKGDAPFAFGSSVFYNTASGFEIYYPSTAKAWSTPLWRGYPAYPITENTAPQFTALGTTNFIVNPWTTVLVTNTATDSDMPAQALTYTLTSGPEGALLNSTNGIFIWRPTMAQAGTTNFVTIVVTDNGAPSLSATQTFSVTVTKTTGVKVVAFKFVSGVPTLTIDGSEGENYVIETSTNLVNWQAAGTNATPLVVPFNWSDTNSPAPFKFYRLHLIP